MLREITVTICKKKAPAFAEAYVMRTADKPEGTIKKASPRQCTSRNQQQKLKKAAINCLFISVRR